MELALDLSEEALNILMYLQENLLGTSFFSGKLQFFGNFYSWKFNKKKNVLQRFSSWVQQDSPF